MLFLRPVSKNERGKDRAFDREMTSSNSCKLNISGDRHLLSQIGDLTGNAC